MDDQGNVAQGCYPQSSGQDANDEVFYDQDPNEPFYEQDPNNEPFDDQHPNNEPFDDQGLNHEPYYPQAPAHYSEDTDNQYEHHHYPDQMQGSEQYGAVAPDYQQYDAAPYIGDPSLNWGGDTDTNFQSEFGQDQEFQVDNSMEFEDADALLGDLIDSNTNPANQEFPIQENKSHQRGPEGQPPAKAPRLLTEGEDREPKAEGNAPTHEDQCGGRQATLFQKNKVLKKQQAENNAMISGFRELKKSNEKIKADPEKQWWKAESGTKLEKAEKLQVFLSKMHKIAIGDMTEPSSCTRRSGVDYGLNYSEKAQDLRAYQSRIPTRRDFGDVDIEDEYFKDEGKNRQEQDEGVSRLGYEYRSPEENDTEECASGEDKAEENSQAEESSEAEEMDVSDSGSEESLDAELGLLDRQTRTAGDYHDDEGFVRDDDEDLSISEANSGADGQIASEEKYAASQEESDSSEVSGQDEGDEDGSE
ncbi:hypothetical protein KC345_g2312 [Hortaea werneckii]|nr:hypothetical protein KC345_g2312 [Hortaea werneckii]